MRIGDSSDKWDVISLKKLIDSNVEELVRETLRAYRASLGAMGASGVQACPSLGTQLQVGLSNLERQLAEGATARRVEETEEQVEAELEKWGEQSAEYYKRKTEEFKEIMMIMARTAEAAGERDQRYSKRFTEFTRQLHSLASIDDLTKIRDSLVRSANELQASVNQMAQDGEQVMAQLRSEVRQYQSKLEESERQASLDSLTGLRNRRGMEAALELRVSQGRAFSVVILDLNGFKRVNDTYGHAAGDDVLKQFATELRPVFRATDDVGRWGGDEFLVVMDCGLEDARRQVERVHQWVFGDYVVRGDGGSHKFLVNASVGAAAWKPGETIADTLARADGEMYQEKKKAQLSGATRSP